MTGLAGTALFTQTDALGAASVAQTESNEFETALTTATTEQATQSSAMDALKNNSLATIMGNLIATAAKLFQAMSVH
jgi:hypothetical protein